MTMRFASPSTNGVGLVALSDPRPRPMAIRPAVVALRPAIATHWDALLASIRALLDRFGPDAVVYPGHGPATTLGRELQSNPFLRELRAAAHE